MLNLKATWPIKHRHIIRKSGFQQQNNGAGCGLAEMMYPQRWDYLVTRLQQPSAIQGGTVDNRIRVAKAATLLRCYMLPLGGMVPQNKVG